MAKHVSDSILLERFVSRREEAAFVDLVKRHGPRVEGTCRRVLRNEHDIEDVFQATFLVLARKAAGIPWRESVGSWLCAVAHRLAMNARADASRHRRRETPFATLGPADDGPRAEAGFPKSTIPWPTRFVEIERSDLRRVLDDELLHLPEKYRAPVVLCDLEGRTHQEAAARARLAVGLDLSPPGAGRGHSFAGDWSTAASSWRPAWWASASPPSLLTRPPSATITDATTVRQLMISLKPVSEDGPGVSNVVARFTREQSSADLAQIITMARQAAQVATEIATHDPGKNRDEWRNYAVEMRRSSVQLAQTTQENNQLAMLTAAHRLDASCLKCHEVFRQ